MYRHYFNFFRKKIWTSHSQFVDSKIQTANFQHFSLKMYSNSGIKTFLFQLIFSRLIRSNRSLIPHWMNFTGCNTISVNLPSAELISKSNHICWSPFFQMCMCVSACITRLFSTCAGVWVWVYCTIKLLQFHTQ